MYICMYIYIYNPSYDFILKQSRDIKDNKSRNFCLQER